MKLFINQLFSKEGKKLGALDYIFCSDDYLLSINKDFLQHDYYTDIITFDLSDSDQITGELYISVDRVKDNAEILGISASQELRRVMFHGALHLCGYKDKKASEKVLMTEKENQYLELFDRYST